MGPNTTMARNNSYNVIQIIVGYHNKIHIFDKIRIITIVCCVVTCCKHKIDSKQPNGISQNTILFQASQRTMKHVPSLPFIEQFFLFGLTTIAVTPSNEHKYI